MDWGPEKDHELLEAAGQLNVKVSRHAAMLLAWGALVQACLALLVEASQRSLREPASCDLNRKVSLWRITFLS